MTIPTRLRQPEVLAAQLASCARIDSGFTRGAAAALRWLLTGGPGPLTCAAAAVGDFRGIVRELAAAEALIYGPAPPAVDFAQGVEHALLWAEFATAAPPTTPSADHSEASERRGTIERPLQEEVPPWASPTS
jgi:hypothetical protein